MDDRRACTSSNGAPIARYHYHSGPMGGKGPAPNQGPGRGFPGGSPATSGAPTGFPFSWLFGTRDVLGSLAIRRGGSEEVARISLAPVATQSPAGSLCGRESVGAVRSGTGPSGNGHGVRGLS